MRLFLPIALLLASTTSVSAAEAVTFNGQIAPLVHAHCASCHRKGGVGPFALLTHRDVASRAAAIGAMVASGTMPPWQAVGNHGEFLGDLRLSEDQKRLMARWIAADCPEGDRDDFPFPPLTTGAWQLGRPDIVLQPVPLRGGDQALRSDDPATVLSAEIAGPDDLWVTAIELRAKHAGFQHALLWLDLPVTAEVLEVDNAGQAIRRTQLLPSWLRERLLVPAPSALRPVERAAAVAARDRRLVGVWAFDSLARAFPAGSAFRFPAGSRLIVESATVQSDLLGAPLEIGLHTSPTPPQRLVATAAVEALAPAIAGGKEVLRQGSFRVPVDCELQLLAPHAGRECREVRVGLTLPSGRSESLLWIEPWKPRWETAYVYRRPLQTPAGSRIDVQLLVTAQPRNAEGATIAGPTLVAAELVPIHTADYDELNRAIQRSQMDTARLPIRGGLRQQNLAVKPTRSARLVRSVRGS